MKIIQRKPETRRFCLFIILCLCVSAAIAYELRPLPAHALTDDMVYVRGGCFQMGDIFSDVPSSAKPVHNVCVDDFYLSRHEVTVGEFRKFVTATGYRTDAERQDGCHTWEDEGIEVKREKYTWRNPGFPQTDEHPVVCISWNDADRYVRWLNARTEGPYRLPTEAEWEYAARSGGKKYEYSWGGGAPDGNVADESTKKEYPEIDIWEGYDDGYVFTSPVGSFRPNDIGIYDMSGNVYEWTADWQEDGYYAKSPKRNPAGPDEGTYKILRGGAWDLGPETARTTHRYWNTAAARAACMGFRIAAGTE